MPRKIVHSTVREVCSLLGAHSPEGLEEKPLSGITTLDGAAETDVAFLARVQYKSRVATSRAGVILVPAGVDSEDPRVIAVADVWKSVLALLNHFYPLPPPEGIIHPTALVPSSCTIGEHVDIGPYCVLGEGVRIGPNSRISCHAVIGDDATIGGGTLLHPRVTIADRCRIGERVILHSGVVIGSDGFRYEPIDRRPTKIPQVGVVIVEDDVEIGANTTIDRASFSQTRVGARTKIDNLVQIGHNCDIGSDCLIVAQVGIAGSTKVGRGVLLAGQVGIGDNLTIGDGARLGARAAVHTNIPPGVDMVGTPAMDPKQYFRILGVMKRLPDLYERLKPILREYEARQSEDESSPDQATVQSVSG